MNDRSVGHNKTRYNYLNIIHVETSHEKNVTTPLMNDRSVGHNKTRTQRI